MVGALVASVLLLAPAGKTDLKDGQACVTGQALEFQIEQRARRTAIRTTIEAGQVIQIVSLGEKSARITEGEQSGIVEMEALVEACAPDVERCIVKQPFEAYGAFAKERRKKFRIKSGAVATVLERTGPNVRIEVAGTEVKTTSEAFDRACTVAQLDRGGDLDVLMEALGPVAKKTRIVLAPMSHDESVSADDIEYFERLLTAELRRRFPRVLTAEPGAIPHDERARPLKRLLKEAKGFAKSVDVKLVAVAHLSQRGDTYSLTYAVFDRRGVRRVALRAAPTYTPGDDWAYKLAKTTQSKLGTR